MQQVVPEIRSRVSVSQKDIARLALEAQARRIDALVRGSGIVNSAGLVALGLTVRKTTYRRIGPPTARPSVRVASVNGPMMRLILNEAGGARGRLPDDVSGAVIYQATGEEPPADPACWTVAAHASRARVNVMIDAPPGTPVHFVAHYLNRRGERGPWGDPRMTHAMGGMQLSRSLAA
jgi:hypothetical protein